METGFLGGPPTFSLVGSVTMAIIRLAEGSELARVRAVLLDYGEVLCFLPTPDAIARMARIFRIDPASFMPIYTQSRGPYDRGDLLPEDYWPAFADDPLARESSFRRSENSNSIEHAVRHGNARKTAFPLAEALRSSDLFRRCATDQARAGDLRGLPESAECAGL